MHSDKLNVGWLKSNAQVIHYFGLGFIQIKLPCSSRMHFYNGSLPSIMPVEEVHNHKYSFTSYILKGTLKHYVYGVEDDPRARSKFVREAETCGSGSIPHWYCPRPVNYGEVYHAEYTAGSSYCVHHDVFHRVKSNWAITYLELGGYEKPYAEVIRDRYADKVCPFSKTIPEPELWKIVGDMIGKV